MVVFPKMISKVDFYKVACNRLLEVAHRQIEANCTREEIEADCTHEDIEAALFSVHPTKSPGPERSFGHFFS